MSDDANSCKYKIEIDEGVVANNVVENSVIVTHFSIVLCRTHVISVTPIGESGRTHSGKSLRFEKGNFCDTKIVFYT